MDTYFTAAMYMNHSQMTSVCYGYLITCTPVAMIVAGVVGIAGAAVIIYDSVSTLIGPNEWDELFPHRLKDYYSYDNFKAAEKTMRRGRFLQGGSSRDDRKRELAAFLAHISHESGELRYKEGRSLGIAYCSGKGRNGKSYHGRGPMRLSWPENYADFSEAYYGDRNILLNDPDLLLQDGQVGFASAIWFWTTRGQKPCHNYMYRTGNEEWGFGYTIININSELEHGHAKAVNGHVTSRIQFYRRFAKFLCVEVGVNGETLQTEKL